MPVDAPQLLDIPAPQATTHSSLGTSQCGEGTVVSRTQAENQMETCGVNLDGTLFLPAQGRTPRVPIKAAKGSRAERSQASSFILREASKQVTKAGVAVISA